MKKILSILLIFTFVFAMASICYAATENIPDPSAPGSGTTTTNVTYPDPIIPDEDIPEGPPETTETTKIGDSSVPKSGELAKTGGVPAVVFYSIGVICIIAALIVSRRKSETKS